MSTSRVIGIDPGPTESAVVWWDGDKVERSSIVASDHVFDEVFWSGAIVACEHIQCFGLAVGKEVFETAYLIGGIREYCRSQAIPFNRVFRSDVKMHLCNSMRAKDPNIRQALIDRFGVVGTKKAPGPLFGIKADLWSALAVAVTAWDKLNAL